MKQPILYGIIVLFGLVAVNGVGITTFLLGEHLHSQKSSPTTAADQEKAGTGTPEFQLVVKESGVNLDCSTGVMTGQDQIPSTLELALLTNLPDVRTTSLVSMSGCPVGPADTVRETY